MCLLLYTLEWLTVCKVLQLRAENAGVVVRLNDGKVERLERDNIDAKDGKNGAAPPPASTQNAASGSAPAPAAGRDGVVGSVSQTPAASSAPAAAVPATGHGGSGAGAAQPPALSAVGGPSVQPPTPSAAAVPVTGHGSSGAGVAQPPAPSAAAVPATGYGSSGAGVAQPPTPSAAAVPATGHSGSGVGGAQAPARTGPTIAGNVGGGRQVSAPTVLGPFAPPPTDDSFARNISARGRTGAAPFVSVNGTAIAHDEPDAAHADLDDRIPNLVQKHCRSDTAAEPALTVYAASELQLPDNLWARSAPARNNLHVMLSRGVFGDLHEVCCVAVVSCLLTSPSPLAQSRVQLCYVPGPIRGFYMPRDALIFINLYFADSFAEPRELFLTLVDTFRGPRVR